MNCKECGVDLTGIAYKMVAEWPFCDACFQSLLNKPASQEAQPVRNEENESIIVKVLCDICEKEIQAGDSRELLGMKMCSQCQQNLVRRPVMPKPAVNDDEEDELTKPKVEQRHIDVRQTTNCSECRRQVPMGGTKELDGKRYCPDCFHALPEVVAKETVYFPPKVGSVADNKTIEAVSQCMACQRPTPLDSLKKVEGFELCMACFGTSPEIALKVARARHQKAIEEMEKELEG